MKTLTAKICFALIFFCLITGCAINEQKSEPSIVLSETQTQAKCNAPIDATQTQYIVGYGSLMQEESRRRTAPNVGSAFPVEVMGVRRGWFAKGTSVGYTTTFLGAIVDKTASMNAAVFSVPAAEVAPIDARESDYCRQLVNPKDLRASAKEGQLPPGQYWIYFNNAESIALAKPQTPVAQSYVDIFLSGCMELGDRYQLSAYAERCIASTTDWPPYWVNDRIHPRRPFANQPKAGRIDRLLNNKLPDLFKSIRLE